MKAKRLYFCIVLTTLLLSACIPNQTPAADPTQPLLPTDLPSTEQTSVEPTTARTTPTKTSGPEEIQLGDLTMEKYELILKPPRDDGSFDTTAGRSSEILKTRRPLRDVFSQAFSPPPLNGRQLTAAEEFTDGKMLVTAKLGDEEVLSVDCGTPSPISNLRGMWVIGQDWYVEAARVENEADGIVVTSNALGDIFMNGVSLNEQFGYDETFGFQPLDDKPFYFFAKDGAIGINYAGETYQLSFDRVYHYACCSAGAYNPKAYLTMVTFFAQRNGKEYYVELGLFSAFDLEVLDLSGAGLTIEAFELQDGSWPDNEHYQSRPTGSLPGWVMKRHEAERKDIIPYQIDSPLFEGKVLSAKQVTQNSIATVEVLLDDELVLSVLVSDLAYAAAMDNIKGSWVHGEHWYVEMVHVDGKLEGNNFSSITNGEVFRSGESLSELFGYDETFGFQILAGEPLFFFRKGDQFGLNYAREEVMLGFDEVAHHYCCGFSVYNPWQYENMVAFFASREGKRYYVEAGVFE